MKRWATVLMLAMTACKDPPPATVPQPPKLQPKQAPMVDDAGQLIEPSHVRPDPKDGVVRKLGDGTLVFTGHTEAILAVAFDAAGKRAVTGGLDRTVRVWDLEKGAELYHFGPGEEAVTALEFDLKGEQLVIGTRAYQVELRDASNGKLLRAKAHPDPVSSVSFSPDGAFIAVAGSSGNADVYPTRDDGKSVCELRARTVQFTADGKTIVGASGAGALVLTSFPACKKGKETSTAPHLPFGAASGTASVVATRNGAEPFVLIWDAVQGRMLGKLDRQQGGVSSVQLSGDGKRALVASDDHHVRLYDVEKREVLKTIDTGELPFAALSPDGTKALISDGIEARLTSLSP